MSVLSTYISHSRIDSSFRILNYHGMYRTNIPIQILAFGPTLAVIIEIGILVWVCKHKKLSSTIYRRVHKEFASKAHGNSLQISQFCQCESNRNRVHIPNTNGIGLQNCACTVTCFYVLWRVKMALANSELLACLLWKFILDMQRQHFQRERQRRRIFREFARALQYHFFLRRRRQRRRYVASYGICVREHTQMRRWCCKWHKGLSRRLPQCMPFIVIAQLS